MQLGKAALGLRLQSTADTFVYRPRCVRVTKGSHTQHPVVRTCREKSESRYENQPPFTAVIISARHGQRTANVSRTRLLGLHRRLMRKRGQQTGRFPFLII